MVRAGHRLAVDTRGVGNPPLPVRMITEGDVAAVVSDAPDDLRARRRDLLAHQGLLLGLAEHGSVLPMRFGSVAEDDATVRGQLREGRQRYAATLRRLDGRVELNVKASPDTDSLDAVVTEDREVRRLRAEVRRRPGYEASLRLGQAVAAAFARRAAEAGRDLLEQLRPLADAVAPGPEVPGCVLNVSFLVERGRQRSFEDTVAAVSSRHEGRAVLRMSGPLPCYSFSGVGSAEPAEV
ncbi:GvpL/GvpF family gas vesicle protein [Streptomyces sp. ICBB 8177]|uniref:GvpL/GvpF family gas vesicle protein n=1 Tax=Streptomyces sp. ICBB 8177 TaxID=563922 RepID=UPI000D67DFF3|nr:GvpL/GvpF family gas vesicle protein [Streptomyces sp. ICBB 8177]PWI41232.1 gas vesicle protein [Streptomyces sp. ICBB 8177]